MRRDAHERVYAFVQWDVCFMQTLCKLPPSGPICIQSMHQPTMKVVENKASGSNSMVESQPSKLLVAGSIPVSRSMFSPNGVLQAGFASARESENRDEKKQQQKDEFDGSHSAYSAFTDHRIGAAHVQLCLSKLHGWQRASV